MTDRGLQRGRRFPLICQRAAVLIIRTGSSRGCALGHEQRCALMCAEAVWWLARLFSSPRSRWSNSIFGEVRCGSIGGILAAIINAIIGAVILLVLVGLIRRTT